MCHSAVICHCPVVQRSCSMLALELSKCVGSTYCHMFVSDYICRHYDRHTPRGIPCKVCQDQGMLSSKVCHRVLYDYLADMSGK